MKNIMTWMSRVPDSSQRWRPRLLCLTWGFIASVSMISAQTPNPNLLPGNSGTCNRATAWQTSGCNHTMRSGYTDGVNGWQSRATPAQAQVCRDACLDCCDEYGGQPEVQRFLNETACECALGAGTGGVKILDCLGPGIEILIEHYGDEWMLHVKKGVDTRDDFLQLHGEMQRDLLGGELPKAAAGTMLNTVNLAAGLLDACENLNDTIDNTFYIPHCRDDCEQTYIGRRIVSSGGSVDPEPEVQVTVDLWFLMMANSGQTSLLWGVGWDRNPSGCPHGLHRGAPCTNSLGQQSKVGPDCECEGVSTQDGCPPEWSFIPGCEQHVTPTSSPL